MLITINMKINSFRAENVHGYLKFEINFFPDLTFLIGINGSGKTSALKLILGLTSPSFHYLNQLQYEFCEVVCSSINNECDIKIRSEKSENDTFTITLDLKGEIFKSTPITRLIKENDSPYDSDELIVAEQRKRELFDSLEIIKKIRELATPKFLGLDRRIYEGRLIDYRFKNKRSFQYSKYGKRNYELQADSPAIDFSLDEVQSLIYDYIRKIAQQQPEISEEFKRRIFKQSFNFIDEGSYKIDPIPNSFESVLERKEKVISAISNLGLSYLNYDVNIYFKHIENIVRQHLEFNKDNKSDVELSKISDEHFEIIRKWYNNGIQLRRIDEIIDYSQEYQGKIAELRAPIKRLETITSNFLKEGQKSLIIEADGEIKVLLKNGKSASIYELSSGEKQIIIMIAHLIFEEDQRPSGIFIIDEPELSLHIAWQDIFVSSIMEASPKTQFILATHAPSIISKVEREVLCQDLNILNN